MVLKRRRLPQYGRRLKRRSAYRSRTGKAYVKPVRSNAYKVKARKRRYLARSSMRSMRPMRAGGYNRKRKQPDVVFGATQLQSAKRVAGAFRSGAYVRKQLVNTSVHTMRLRHSAITDWTADNPYTGHLRGQTFLSYDPGQAGGAPNPDFTSMPVRLINLFSTYQTAANRAAPMWELLYDTTLLTYRWFSAYGRDNTGAAAQPWQLENNSAFGTSVGGIRNKGFIRWSRARLMFYGKQNQDTRITVQVIKFLKDEHCPENYLVTAGFTDGVTYETKEGYDQIVKPLINNPLSSQIRNQRPIYKVLKSYQINIDPTVSIDNDKDVEKRVLDIFNRWNRVIDFTPANPNATTLTALENANQWPAPVTSNSAYPTVPHHIKDSVYILIKSQQPTFLLDDDPEADPPTRSEDTTASMDWNVQTCWQELADG